MGLPRLRVADEVGRAIRLGAKSHRIQVRPRIGLMLWRAEMVVARDSASKNALAASDSHHAGLSDACRRTEGCRPGPSNASAARSSGACKAQSRTTSAAGTAAAAAAFLPPRVLGAVLAAAAGLAARSARLAASLSASSSAVYAARNRDGNCREWMTWYSDASWGKGKKNGIAVLAAMRVKT